MAARKPKERGTTPADFFHKFEQFLRENHISSLETCSDDYGDREVRLYTSEGGYRIEYRASVGLTVKPTEPEEMTIKNGEIVK